MKKDIIEKIEIPEGVNITIEGSLISVKSGDKENKKRVNLTNINSKIERNEVVLETKEDKIMIEKPITDILEQMEEIAHKGKPVSKIHSDKDYEKMLEERWKDLKFT